MRRGFFSASIRNTMFPLLSLPSDLIHPIIDSVDDRSDLLSLAQTCTQLRSLTEARLFKSIKVQHGKHAERLSAVLDVRPARYGYVQNLEVVPGPRHWKGIEVMPELIKRMHNLRELRVESPLINYFPTKAGGQMTPCLRIWGCSSRPMNYQVRKPH